MQRPLLSVDSCWQLRHLPRCLQTTVLAFIAFVTFLTHYSYAVGVGVCGTMHLSPVCLSVAKRCKIEPRLLLITNRKLHTGYQMTRKSLTLDKHKSQYALLWLNGKRQRQCCYCSLIENRIRLFRQDENHRPWMISKVSTATSCSGSTLPEYIACVALDANYAWC